MMTYSDQNINSRTRIFELLRQRDAAKACASKPTRSDEDFASAEDLDQFLKSAIQSFESRN